MRNLPTVISEADKYFQQTVGDSTYWYFTRFFWVWVSVLFVVWV